MECTAKPFSFLVNDSLRFRKLFLKYNKNHDN